MCKAGGRWSAASRRGTNTKSYQVAHAAPGGRVPPSDGKAQGRWSAASRRGTKPAGHSLLMPRPEVTAHPATAMRKAGGPRRRDAEQSRQVTRCSCRARRSRPTQRRQCARQVAGGPRRPDAELIPNLIRLLMPRPEVTAHPATAMHKAGGPRRRDAEQSRQVTRCSCRARRSRPARAGARGLLLRPHPPHPNSQTDND